MHSLYHSCFDKTVCGLDVLPLHEICPVCNGDFPEIMSIMQTFLSFSCIYKTDISQQTIISKMNTGHSTRCSDASPWCKQHFSALWRSDQHHSNCMTENFWKLKGLKLPQLPTLPLTITAASSVIAWVLWITFIQCFYSLTLKLLLIKPVIKFLSGISINTQFNNWGAGKCFHFRAKSKTPWCFWVSLKHVTQRTAIPHEHSIWQVRD